MGGGGNKNHYLVVDNEVLLVECVRVVVLDGEGAGSQVHAAPSQVQQHILRTNIVYNNL